MDRDLRLQASPWSTGGILVAGAVAAEVAVAWTLATSPAQVGRGMAGSCALVMIASLFVTGRCRMPAPVKLSLIAVATAVLLGWFATEDASGFKAVDGLASRALAENAAHAGDRVHVRMGTATTGSDLDTQIDDAVRPVLADSGVRLETRIHAVDQEVKPNYRVSWTLVRGDERRWCGSLSIDDRESADLSLLRDRVAGAVRRSKGTTLQCD